ncbi:MULTISPECIES: winged helix DNA-binding domain-containing protein [unclassified Amycolatopsis]|uniref:winged helix DNA-binding domain-containing protein n=1 Tax=unclassified Amycolatopsis TaxID=2618356 RepID=UPI001F0F89EA|nr:MULTISPECIES: winged helix DNA-binding domain-containing protein [unclassified Amycolatopsis]
MTLAQRRARLGIRHHLAARATTVEEAVDGVVALHATDPASVYLSAWSRVRDVSIADVEDALYSRRTLLRILGMRRTVFVTDVATAGAVQAACSYDVAARQRRLLEKQLGTLGHPENVARPGEWLDEVMASVEKALRARGSATAQQLADDEPRLRQQLLMAKGKPYESIGNVTSRVLFQLAAEGHIVRGRPRGSWQSTQYHWSPLTDWLANAEGSAGSGAGRGGKTGAGSGSPALVPADSPGSTAGNPRHSVPDVAGSGSGTSGPGRSRPGTAGQPNGSGLGTIGGPPDWAGLSEDEARAALARRWLHAFGPAPVADLRWWTGWTAGQTKKALTAVAPAEVDLDGEPAIALPGDLAPVAAPDPWISLLPALDPTAMGWQYRDWYVGPHRPALFDRSGNIGPTVWSDGRIVGAWCHRPSGEVAVRLLEDIGTEKTAAVDAEASRLSAWLGEARVVPKFRTPAEKELAEQGGKELAG